MKQLQAQLTTLTATLTALSVVIAIDANNPVQAITINFNWQGEGGYSAEGMFSYDETTAPVTITESGAGSTNVLDSLTVSFFDPSNNLLQSFNSVVNKVSDSSYFTFNFDTTTQSLFGAINIGGGTGVIGELFFLGTIGDTLDLRQDVDQMGTSTLLDSQNPGVIPVSVVPEPTSVLGLLAFGAFGAGSALKKNKFLRQGKRI